jgi:hypothetical protein
MQTKYWRFVRIEEIKNYNPVYGDTGLMCDLRPPIRFLH